MWAKVYRSFLMGFLLTWVSYGITNLFITNVEVNLLEMFAVVTSYACTWLCVLESRANYPIGVITTASYCLLFIQFDLVASAIVNAYLVFQLAYGWFRWGRDENTRPVQHVAWRWLPMYGLVTAVAYLGALGLTKAFGGSLALTDSVILVGTILAQFLLDNKKIETWLVWVVVNVFAIYTYFNADLPLAGFQYIFFLINTAIGYAMWNKSMKDAKVQYAADSQLAKANLKSLTPKVSEI